jgi:TetR/AcrR family transcriptional regulator
VKAKAAVIKGWIEAGKINPVEPEHLIFAIWSVTQHYADFSVQVEAVLGQKPQAKPLAATILQILLGGLKPQAATA